MNHYNVQPAILVLSSFLAGAVFGIAVAPRLVLALLVAALLFPSGAPSGGVPSTSISTSISTSVEPRKPSS